LQDSDAPDSTRDFLRFLAGALIVLVVVYAGILLFFLTGPSLDDVENLRKIVFIALLGAIVAWGIVLFVGARFYTVTHGAGPEAQPPARLAVSAALPAEYPAEAEPEEQLEHEAGPDKADEDK